MKVQPHADAESYFNSWAETFSVPTVLLRLDAHILWVNGSAERMLLQGTIFARQADQLICVDKAQAGHFRTFLASLGGAPEAWILSHPDQSHVVVRGEALRPAGEPPAAALMMYTTRSDQRYVWADLGGVFHLTKSEMVVLKALVGGDSADGIAHQLGVSLETIRTHVRRLYCKLSVNNREQLFAIVSPFRVG